MLTQLAPPSGSCWSVAAGGGVLTVETLERLAAVAALAAAGAVMVSYAVALLFVPALPVQPGAPGAEEWATWMEIPRVLMLLVGAGVPLVGAVLLRDEREHRREAGAAVMAAFGLLSALALPSHLVNFTVPVDMAALAQSAAFVGFLVAVAVGGVFAALALVRNASVRWVDPRRLDRFVWRAVLFAGLALAAVASVAPSTRQVDALDTSSGGILLGDLFAVGLEGALGWWTLPALGLIAVAVAVVGARPTRVAVGAGVVVAANELVGVIADPIGTAMSVRVYDQAMQLTVWYGVHVVAVVALCASLFALWRSVGRQRARPAERDRAV